MSASQSSSSPRVIPHLNTAGQENPGQENFFITEREFREEIIYFIIVDRFLTLRVTMRSDLAFGIVGPLPDCMIKPGHNGVSTGVEIFLGS